MDDQLKSFTSSHREEFDLYDPSPALWSRIETGLQQAPVKRMHTVRLRIIQAVAAAAVLIGGWFLVNNTTGKGKKQQAETAARQTPVINNDPQTNDAQQNLTPAPVKQEETKMPELAVNTVPKTNTPAKRNKPVAEKAPEADPLSAFAVNKSKEQYVNNYLKTNVPEMHTRFSEDLTSLQQQYAQLEKQLKQGINRDKILAAMQQNLEMQNQLVNRQLNVIKEIKQLKNPKNENFSRKIA